ncbi:hypothetical protein ACFWGD_10900 [Corynebacterium sp. NPDC060344]|uniref:hypothetical protein n=1 Tax=Corynebacterium sp. NPDC060344 TaxID=3347101 RepID=UPI003651F8BF
MSSPFGDDRPGGRGANGGNGGANGGGRDRTEQWEPIDGEAWSNAPGAYDGSGWGTAAPGDSYAGGGQSGQGSQGGYGGSGGFGAQGSYGAQGGPGAFPTGQGEYRPSSDGYPGGYPGGYPSGYSGAYPQSQQSGGKGGSGGGKIALIILAALLIVAAGGALGYFLLADRDDGGSGGDPTQTTAAPTQSQPTETSAPGRAEGFVAPASWGKCGGSGEPGDLNLYYAGTSTTSCPFTKAVRDSFVDHYNATDQLDGTITAYSPVTGQTYSMSCTDDGDYVTCRGGNNAVVHIV